MTVGFYGTIATYVIVQHLTPLDTAVGVRGHSLVPATTCPIRLVPTQPPSGCRCQHARRLWEGEEADRAAVARGRAVRHR